MTRDRWLLFLSFTFQHAVVLNTHRITLSLPPCTRQAVDGVGVAEGSRDTPAATSASIVGGVSSEESLPPAEDEALAGAGPDATAEASGEVTASLSASVVEDVVPIPSAESVEVSGEQCPEAADNGSAATGSAKEEERQTADAASPGQASPLQKMAGQSTPVEAVGGAAVPEMVSATAAAAAQSVCSWQLNLRDVTEHVECLPAASSSPATHVNGAAAAAAAAAGDEVSLGDGEEAEQPVRLGGGQGAVVAGVVMETAEAANSGSAATGIAQEEAIASPQSADVVAAGEAQPAAGSAAIEDAPETGPEQRSVSMAPAAAEGDAAAAAAAGVAAVSSSSPDAVPVAVAEETSPGAVGSVDAESIGRPACATGDEVANDDERAVRTCAQALGADGPPAASSEQEVCVVVVKLS